MYSKSSPLRSWLLQVSTVSLLISGMGVQAAPPAWWTAGSPPAVNSSPENNKGMASVGQAKWMAQSAMEALEDAFGENSTVVEAIREDLYKATPTSANGIFYPGQPPGLEGAALATWKENQKAPLRIGGLKALATPFYKHLAALDGEWVKDELEDNGLTLDETFFQDSDEVWYPWDPADNSDHAKNTSITTIGQLKLVFSLRFEGLAGTADPDNDGLTTAQEMTAGTDPTNPDTDADGMPDGWEETNGLDPLSASDAYDDPDSDFVENVREYQLGTSINSPTLDADSDAVYDDMEKNIAKALLGSPKTPTEWGGLYDDLTSGDLDPATVYTDDGETVADLAAVFSAIPKGGAGASLGIYTQEQSRAVMVHGWHSEVPPMGEPETIYGTYQESDKEEEEITFFHQMLPEFLETQVGYVQWPTEPTIKNDTWNFTPSATVENRFYIKSAGGVISDYERGGHSIQSRFRLVRKGSPGHTLKRTCLRFIQKREIGDSGDWTFVSADRVEFEIGGTSFVSNWVTLDPPIIVGYETQSVMYPIDLSVDTNRDGKISPGTNMDDDGNGEDTWTKDRGAIYMVNYDRDGKRISGGENRPDAIHFDDNGNGIDEDGVIESLNDANQETTDDELDITPVRFSNPGSIPAETKIFLKVEEAEDLRAIHLYPRTKKGTEAIWGSLQNPTSSSWTWGDYDLTDLELDVTNLLHPDKPGYLGYNESVGGFDCMLGIEGLLLAGMKVPDYSVFPAQFLPNPFSGEIKLTVEYRFGEGEEAQVIEGDTVKLRVAPWIAQNNTQQAQKVFIEEGGLNAEGKPNNLLEHLLGAEADAIPWQESSTRWIQDHVEIGYTQRPSTDGTVTQTIAFRLPYDRGDGDCDDASDPQPEWPLTKFLGRNQGIFQMGLAMPDGRPNTHWGGNIEVLPPTQQHPLGRLVAGGSDWSPDLQKFFAAQGVQKFHPAPGQENSALLVDWLSVGHVDEVFGFLGPRTGAKNRVVIADPVLGITQLQSVPELDREGTLLFNKGDVKLGTIAGATSFTTNLTTGINHTNDTEYKYIRFLNGAAKGTVCRISGYTTNGLVVDRTWHTGNKVLSMTTIPTTGPDYLAWKNYYYGTYDTSCSINVPHPGAHQTITVDAGTRYILFQDPLFWGSYLPATETGMPAAITVKELLDDQGFMHSHTHADGVFKKVMEENRTKIAGLNVAEVDFVEVPALFLGSYLDNYPDFKTKHSAEAFVPAATNFLTLGKDKLIYVPEQHVKDLDDPFENTIDSAILGSVIFTDEWDFYHTLRGELHCGTAPLRATPAGLKWWTKQP